ncbi:MAG: hypothetical protein PWR20_1478 [Bacteroidales bacterium]|jgi:hypothetical protein|nr:hypothetical protein [Bacteroidales bacterium]MDN5330267.1 hypothetical protein [Bacteroidales bacterium]
MKKCKKKDIKVIESHAFKCKRCGATAKKKEKLCKPEKNG